MGVRQNPAVFGDRTLLRWGRSRASSCVLICDNLRHLRIPYEFYVSQIRQMTPILCYMRIVSEANIRSPRHG